VDESAVVIQVVVFHREGFCSFQELIEFMTLKN
jgi:hypothetical protein